jgi:predicted MFS family arabinose efflux permease
MSLVEDTTVVEDEQAAQPGATSTTGAPLPPLWRNRDYMLLWSGQVVSALGGNMSGIVFPLLILALTSNDTTIAGIAGALGSIPYLLFSLPVGALIDRWNRKRVMMICDTFRAINMASIPLALSFNALTVGQLLVNSFIEGTFFVFFNLAEVAAISRVVNKRQLPQASAQNEAGFISATLVGPPIGTFLFQSLGRGVPFLVDAISYGASVISLLFIKTPFQGERKVEERHLLVEIREGLSWLWHNPLIRFMALLTGGYNFCNAATFLILIILAKQLGATDGEIGIMVSLAALGGIVGSVLGGQIQKRFTFGQVIIALAWIAAAFYLLYLFAPNFLLLGLFAGLSWMISPIYNVVQFSYRLALIPDRLQGRVNSTFRLLAFGFQPLGSAIAGVLLKYAGTTNTLLFYLAVLIFLAIMVTLNSHVRNARPIGEVALSE